MMRLARNLAVLALFCFGASACVSCYKDAAKREAEKMANCKLTADIAGIVRAYECNGATVIR